MQPCPCIGLPTALGDQASWFWGLLLQTPAITEQPRPLLMCPIPASPQPGHCKASEVLPVSLLAGAGGTLGARAAPIPALGSEGGSGGGEAGTALP